MQYTTLDQLQHALEHSSQDRLVVLALGNESASVWPPGHPEGWSEDCPRVFRVPAGMNGEAREFLREEINKRNGWSITGDEPPSSFLDELDFAVQGDLFDPTKLAPPAADRSEEEGFPHKIWAILASYGPQTVQSMMDFVEADRQKVRACLNFLKRDGYAEIEFHNHRGTYTAIKEPPYYARGVLTIRRRKEILEMLEDGPMLAREIGEAINLPKDQTQPILGAMKKEGLLQYYGNRCANNLKWKLA